jgi:rhamnogalacturonan hydrolase
MCFKMKALLLALFVLFSVSTAQLAGRVGPTTSAATKSARKTCNITSYGAKQGKGGDIGPAIMAAFNACKTGGTIVIPSGDWGLKTWVNLSGGKSFAIQWEGTIHRSGEAGGNMIMVQRSDDVEIFSTTGRGAFQGNGYQYHAKGSIQGPRILRFVKVTNFAVHDIKMVDAPAFHFSMDTCKNGEVYNIIIRGAYMGGIDGIDVWSENVWIHDVSAGLQNHKQQTLITTGNGYQQG